MSSFFKSLNNYFFMKKLNNEQMENLQGGLIQIPWGNCAGGELMVIAALDGSGNIRDIDLWNLGMNVQFATC